MRPRFSSSGGLRSARVTGGTSDTQRWRTAKSRARVLGLEAYRIDLSQVISKYIGETEKNLRRVFDEAERTGAILYFDEAEELFGKRADIKSADVRHARAARSYLLRTARRRGLKLIVGKAGAKQDPKDPIGHKAHKTE